MPHGVNIELAPLACRHARSIGATCSRTCRLDPLYGIAQILRLDVRVDRCAQLRIVTAGAQNNQPRTWARRNTASR
jgi:hypothetical protein